jgi:hypothetical protein
MGHLNCDSNEKYAENSRFQIENNHRFDINQLVNSNPEKFLSISSDGILQRNEQGEVLVNATNS